MTNVSDYPITVDGVRLDTLAKGVEASSLTLGGLRSGDTLLAGLDGVVASVDDSREPSSLGLSMFVRGTDDDGLVPFGQDGQAVYQENLQALKHLLAKSGTLLDVRRVVDKNTMLSRVNLQTNPSWRGATAGGVEVRRNLTPNPSFRGTAGTVEVRRNYLTDPHGLNAAAWGNYTGVGAVTSEAGGAYSGSAGIVATMPGSGAVTTPRIANASGVQPLNFAAGDTITLQAKIRAAAGTGWEAGAAPMMFLRGPTTGVEWVIGAPTITVLGAGWWLVSLTATLPAIATGAVVLNIGIDNVGVVPPATAKFHVDEIMVEKIGALLPFMTGSTVAADGLTYSWVGAANASASIATGNAVTDWGGSARVVWRGADGASLRMLATGVNANIYQAAGCPAAPGESFAASFEVDADTGGDTARLQVFFYSPGISAGYSSGETVVTNPTTLGGVTTPAPASTTLVRSSVLITNAVGHLFTIRKSLVEKAQVVLPWFDALTAAANGLTYSWAGAANASESIAAGTRAGDSPFQFYAATGLIVGWISAPGVYSILTKRALADSEIIAYQATGAPAATPGAYYAGRFKVRRAVSAGASSLRATISAYDGLQNHAGFIAENTPAVPVDGSWLDLAAPSTLVAPPTTVTHRWLIYSWGATPAGTTLEFKDALTETVTGLGVQPGPYMDGNTAGAGWTGAPDASTSATPTSELQAWAKVQDAITPEDHPGDVGRLAAVLMVPGVYWRSVAALTWASGPVTSGVGMAVPTLDTSSAPIDDAVICLAGPANAGAMIYDLATMSFVRLNEAIPAGSTWRVNVGTWESRVGVGLTVDSADTAGTDKSGVTDQGGMYPRLLRLNPRLNAGARRVLVAVVGAGFTATTTLSIKARRAHL